MITKYPKSIKPSPRDGSISYCFIVVWEGAAEVCACRITRILVVFWSSSALCEWPVAKCHLATWAERWAQQMGMGGRSERGGRGMTKWLDLKNRSQEEEREREWYELCTQIFFADALWKKISYVFLFIKVISSFFLRILKIPLSTDWVHNDIGSNTHLHRHVHPQSHPDQKYSGR